MTRWLGVVACLCLFGCGEDAGECDRLDVQRRAGQAEGRTVFEGTADGAAFHCAFDVWSANLESVEADGQCVDGPVDLRIEEGAKVTARFRGGPARVDWTFSFTNLGRAPERYQGTLEPAYDADGCRQASASVP